jgi:5-methylcytosine-specific restriction enzyme subunit McrC
VTVGEYASLTTHAVDSPSLSLAQVSTSAFDYLCALNEQFSRRGANLLLVNGRSRLRLDSHVGVIHTPCGTTIEILPKHTASAKEYDKHASRRLLRRLIQSMFELTAREVGQASLETFDAPLNEWVMARFLEELDRVVRKGLRFDYQRVEEEQPFLRGQLDFVAQLRQPPGREHRFQIRHDIFTSNRPENRLLRSALEIVRRQTSRTDSWRSAHELCVRLAEVPQSTNVSDDFRAWGNDRLLAHYRAARPWCEIILLHSMPLALNGATPGLSLLFPMEKVFEQHVAVCLRRQLDPRCRIRTPAASEYLCHLDGKRMFRLEPDILVEFPDGRAWVLDAKWKLIDEHDSTGKYGLSQSDFYQLFAYGQRYLGGEGQMALIYPKTPQMGQPIGPFAFSPALRLHVIPFDLEKDSIVDSFDMLQLPWSTTH